VGKALGRCSIAEGIVGSLFVVFDHPPVDGFADVIQGGEAISIQDVFAKGPLESLDVAVLVPTSPRLAPDAYGCSRT
jgi:hypothetical protein